MKNFQESPMNKGDEAEESTWTFYFEEFICQNDQEMIMSCNNETLNSLIPDATSSAIVKKVAYFQDDQANKIGFKKRKTEVVFDDSLEDTASSPLSSPKVAYFDQEEIKNKKTVHILEEKVGTYEEQNKKMVDTNMELKKRGLCLVPLSSLSNYLS